VINEPTEFQKDDILAVLRRAGVTEETLQAVDAELPDPVEAAHVQDLLGRYGITLDAIIDRMGGSP
jgi:hypothetical protein